MRGSSGSAKCRRASARTLATAGPLFVRRRATWIQLFLDQGLTLKVIAGKWGLKTARERGYLGYRLRECLDTLAVTFGYARSMAHKHEQPAIEG